LDYGAINLDKGGNAIPYREEDPHLRKEFEENLAKEGRQSRMSAALYEDPAADDAVFTGM
jgi:hypothetical protein